MSQSELDNFKEHIKNLLKDKFVNMERLEKLCLLADIGLAHVLHEKSYNGIRYSKNKYTDYLVAESLKKDNEEIK